MIYTTNVAEPLHMSLCKVTKDRGSFRTQEAAIQAAVSGAEECRQEVAHGAGLARGAPQFAIRWPERIEQSRGRVTRKISMKAKIAFAQKSGHHLHFTPEQEAQLAQMAIKAGKDAERLVKVLFCVYLKMKCPSPVLCLNCRAGI